MHLKDCFIFSTVEVYIVFWCLTRKFLREGVHLSNGTVTFIIL